MTEASDRLKREIAKGKREKWESLFAGQLAAESNELGWLRGFQREYRFTPERKWRFDFAWPSRSVAVEIEGGIWNNGAHVRGAHFESDAEKYNEAAALGWKVGRFTPAMVKCGDALRWIERMLK